MLSIFVLILVLSLLRRHSTASHDASATDLSTCHCSKHRSSRIRLSDDCHSVASPVLLLFVLLLLLLVVLVLALLFLRPAASTSARLLRLFLR